MAKRVPLKAGIPALLLLTSIAGVSVFSYVDSENRLQDIDERLKVAEDALIQLEAEEAESARQERLADAQRDREAREREAEVAAQARRDDAMASIGFDPVADGVYFKWLEDSEFQCGYWDCIGFAIGVSGTSCSSIYVEANIYAGETVVDWTNARVGSLSDGTFATGIFEDVRGAGDSFGLTEVNCLG